MPDDGFRWLGLDICGISSVATLQQFG